MPFMDLKMCPDKLSMPQDYIESTRNMRPIKRVGQLAQTQIDLNDLWTAGVHDHHGAGPTLGACAIQNLPHQQST